MTCRHRAGDTSCSSHPDNIERRAYEAEQERRNEETRKRDKERQEQMSKTPDKKEYTIVDAAVVGKHLVIKVLYPNCAKCSYEGNKVIVFLNTTTLDALKWREIDPHFRELAPSAIWADDFIGPDKHSAPPPAARFPASPEGWADAISYAENKNKRI